MKKLFAMFVVAGMVAFVACGPSAEEKAEKARQDSIALADSLAHTNATNTVISRFQVTSNPDSADKDSEFQILTFTQPYSNHNGGWIGFGPNDGYLYIANGDGGSGGDPQNYAQRINTLLGKNSSY